MDGCLPNKITTLVEQCYIDAYLHGTLDHGGRFCVGIQIRHMPSRSDDQDSFVAAENRYID